MHAAIALSAFERGGISFYTGVPDSYLHGFCEELSTCGTCRNITAANEGNAVAIAAGHYLATGEIPLVYLQNSGLGNALNPLASLVNREMLGIPMILLVGWRGDPFHDDHAQHMLQGRITPAILAALEIPWAELPDDDQAAPLVISDMLRLAKARKAPVALLSPKGVLSGTKSFLSAGSYPLSREEAIEVILNAAPANALYSATTGRAARELHHLRRARGESGKGDYLNAGAMGHASSLALGMALGQPDRPVICFDGDAACIMHLGSLAIIGTSGAENLLHIVLNNGLHESVGGQPTAAFDVNLTGMASACGYRTAGRPLYESAEITDAVRDFCSTKGPSFIDLRIRAGIRQDLPGFEIDPTRMRDGLLETCAGKSEKYGRWNCERKDPQ